MICVVTFFEVRKCCPMSTSLSFLLSQMSRVKARSGQLVMDTDAVDDQVFLCDLTCSSRFTALCCRCLYLH